jgi:hypothetical protein
MSYCTIPEPCCGQPMSLIPRSRCCDTCGEPDDHCDCDDPDLDRPCSEVFGCDNECGTVRDHRGEDDAYAHFECLVCKQVFGSLIGHRFGSLRSDEMSLDAWHEGPWRKAETGLLHSEDAPVDLGRYVPPVDKPD